MPLYISLIHPLIMGRQGYEKWKVYGNVFDNYTLRLLFKLSTEGHFEKLLSPVSIGKEANVFTAKTLDGRDVIAKIYRLESCNFNKMFDYIKSDVRFENLRRQRRKVIFAWVMREYQNLLKAREAGVNVPRPLTVKQHILILEMIGDKTPALKLKDINREEQAKVAEKILQNMKKMYTAGLVHGDLSEYNILIHNGTPYFIDFSQGTTRRDPNYDEYWLRDIKNVSKFLTNKLKLKISDDDIKKKIGYSP
jgi:RIO kinase 1